MKPKNIILDGVETQVFSAEIMRATPPATRRTVKLPAGSLAPITVVGIPVRPTKPGLVGSRINTSVSETKEKGTQVKINVLALTRCEIRLLLVDRALICVTDSFVPPQEVTAVDTQLNQLRLESGTLTPANISGRKLLAHERILVNQLQSMAAATEAAEANRKRDAATAELAVKIDAQGVKVNKVAGNLETLVDMTAEKAAQLNQWGENPLGSREAIANYLLTTKELYIQDDVAVALLAHAYGKTQKAAAADAGVDLSTVKRALRKIENTPYKKAFDKTRKQKLEARQSMGSGTLAKMIQLSKSLSQEDKDKLRVVYDEMFNSAQRVDDLDYVPSNRRKIPKQS